MDFEPIKVFIERSGEYLASGGWTTSSYQQEGKPFKEWRWSIDTYPNIGIPGAVDCQIEITRQRGWTQTGVADNVSAVWSEFGPVAVIG